MKNKGNFKVVLGSLLLSSVLFVSCKKEDVKPTTSTTTNNASTSEIFQFETTFGAVTKSWKGSSKGDTTTQAACEINDSLAVLGLISEQDQFYFTYSTDQKKFTSGTVKKTVDQMFSPEIFIMDGETGYFVAKEDDSISITYSKVPTTSGGILKGTFKGKVSKLDENTFLPTDSKNITGSFTAYRIK